MSRTIPLSASANVVLNGSGEGQVTLGPALPGVIWHPSSGSVTVSSANNVPIFAVYLNAISLPTFRGGSETGSNDTFTASDETLYPGQELIGVWVGGDPGATATFNVQGTQDVPG